MSGLSDLLNVIVSLQAPGIPAQGFGVPLILSQNASWSQRVRTYGSLAAVLTDFAANSPEYNCAQALFGQRNTPPQIMIGRANTSPVTQGWLMGLVLVQIGSTYKCYVTDPTGAPSRLVFSFTLAAQAAWAASTIEAVGTIVPDTSSGYWTVSSVTLDAKTASGSNPLTFSANSPLTDNHVVWTYYATLAAAQADAVVMSLARSINSAKGSAWVASTQYNFTAGSVNPVVVLNGGNYYQLASSGKTAGSGGPTGTGSGIADGTATWNYLGTTAPILSVGTAAVSVGTGQLTLTCSAATGWLALEIDDPTLEVAVQTETGLSATNLKADLSAINNANGGWYFLVSLYDSPAYDEVCAQWVNGLGAYQKIYFPQSTQTAVALNVAGTSDTLTSAVDDLDAMLAAGYTSVASAFHPRASDWLAAAEVGFWCPSVPGSENWRMKTLAGPTTGWGNGTQYTGTQVTNITARNANYYYDIVPETSVVGGAGLIAAGSAYIDVVRYTSSFINDVQTRGANLLIQNDKVPYTDAGITSVEAVVRAAIQDGIAAGAIDPGSPPGIAAPTVTSPTAGSASSANRAARNLAGLTASFTLAGAINKVNPLTVTILQ